MFIDSSLFTFPFDDKRWVSKFAIGTGLVLLAIALPPFSLFLFWIMLPVVGYSQRILRSTGRGEPPSMPEWDDWTDLFLDGLKVSLIFIVYMLPVIMLMCAMYAIWMGVGFSPLFIDVDAPRSSSAIMPFVFGMYGVSFMLMGCIFLLAIPLTLFALVAETRYAMTGSLSKAFEFGEVWSLLRRGARHFLLVYLIFVAINFALNFVVQMSSAMPVLCCVTPILAGMAYFYIQTHAAAMFGTAYYHTEKDASAPPADPPAPRDTRPLKKTEVLEKAPSRPPSDIPPVPAAPAEAAVAPSTAPAAYDDGSTDEVPMVDPKEVKIPPPPGAPKAEPETPPAEPKAALAGPKAAKPRKPRATKPKSTRPRKPKAGDKDETA